MTSKFLWYMVLVGALHYGLELSAGELRGSFVIEKQYDSVPQFECMYQGVSFTSNSEGFFSVRTVEQIPARLSIIFSTATAYKHNKHNTFHNMYVKEAASYKEYALMRRLDDPQSFSWEVIASKDNFTIPENALVIGIDPAFVIGLEAWKTGTISADIIKLPRIRLQVSYEQGALANETAKSLLGDALERRTFSSRQSSVRQTSRPNASLVQVSR